MSGADSPMQRPRILPLPPFGVKDTVKRTPDFFGLGEDILLYMLRYIGARDLCKFAQVSNFCLQLAYDNTLWKWLVLKDWSLPNPRTKDWRRYYEKRHFQRLEKVRLRLAMEQQQQQRQHMAAAASAGHTVRSVSIQQQFLRKDYAIGHRWRLLKKIGSGSFGEIFSAAGPGDDRVAVKFEPTNTRHPQLLYEYKVYRCLRGGNGIPGVHYFGVEQGYNILVMDLLGPSLEDCFVQCNRRFSLKTILMLGQQMIRLVEYMHTRNFIHRDIKPDNFVMGRGRRAAQVHILDFGLAKKFRDSKTHAHLPYRTLKSLTGTPRYASINSHLGIEQSRRDDLESLGYVLLYFCRGNLPWQGLPARNKKQKYQKITEKKVSTPLDVLCEGFPNEFCQYLKYTKSLRFVDKPDYEYLLRLFRDLFTRRGYQFNGVYDWTPQQSGGAAALTEGESSAAAEGFADAALPGSAAPADAAEGVVPQTEIVRERTDEPAKPTMASGQSQLDSSVIAISTATQHGSASSPSHRPHVASSDASAPPDDGRRKASRDKKEKVDKRR